MKTTWASLGLLILSGLMTSAQTKEDATVVRSTKPGTVAETEFSVSERGPHHKIWERIEYEPTYDGRLVPRRRSYQELATGLNFLNENGVWEESQEKIEVLPNNAGAAASKGQHKAIFPPEIKAGIIELQTPDGKWLRSRVWGVAYFDSTTGESVLLAEVKESEGQLVGDNAVVYPDAFTDFLADVRYTYTRAGFEQDVVLRDQPPSPKEFGLNPKTTRLQVLTEFVEAQPPTKLQQQAGGLIDETLGFGQAMTIGSGKAFSVDGEGDATGHVPVAKGWEQLEGRDFLIEQVLYEKVSEQLQKLPEAKKYEGASLQRRGRGESVLAGLKELMPMRYAKTAPKPGKRRMAQVPPLTSPSFVMDYVSLNSSVTNYIYKGDTTYYLSGTYYSYGTNTFEGGTVIKYATNASLQIIPISSNPQIVWRADAYRPVVFTAKDDNSVGETISGATGNPTGPNYANPALNIVSAGSPVLANYRIAYARQALSLTSGSYQLWHGQIVNCGFGITGGGSAVFLANSLFANVRTNFNLPTGMGIAAENVTFNWCGYLATRPGVGPNLTFTNCIFANVTNLTSGSVSVVGAYNGFYGSSTFGVSQTNTTTYPFQTNGGGAHYLVVNAFRNTGTTNLTTGLLTGLAKRTTFPPVAFTNVTFTNPTNFNPQAQRDTDTPDLGYHYDPLDYSFGGCHANSNITFTAGTAVGWFRTTSGWTHAGHGIHLGDKQIGAFEGTVTSPCYWVRLSTVQENDRSAGYGPGGMTGWAANLANAPEIQLRFTRCSMLSYDLWNHFRDDNGWLKLRATDCEFYGNSMGGYVMSLLFTNCLFQRTSLAQVDGNGGCAVALRNCTMFGGTLQLTPSQPSYYTVLDSAFEDVAFTISGYAANSSYATNDYNAYTNASNPFPIGGSHNVRVSSFNWQTGYLGSFYLPANSTLINTGSVTAPNIALYHYTTQTNQAKETSSQVDLGYHYVALNASNNPVDSDNDGLLDYLEDANGNGSYQSGADLANWQSPDTDGDNIGDGIEVAIGRNPKIAPAVDTQGIVSLVVFTKSR